MLLTSWFSFHLNSPRFGASPRRSVDDPVSSPNHSAMYHYFMKITICISTHIPLTCPKWKRLCSWLIHFVCVDSLYIKYMLQSSYPPALKITRENDFSYPIYYQRVPFMDPTGTGASATCSSWRSRDFSSSWRFIKISPCQWIGLRGNLQETRVFTMVFTIKCRGVL